jgi:hypothetical protein
MASARTSETNNAGTKTERFLIIVRSLEEVCRFAHLVRDAAEQPCTQKRGRKAARSVPPLFR